jgi:hypothetical protein
VIERGCGLGLTLKATACLVSRHLLEQELDCDRSAEACVERTVYHGHPADADECLQFVRAKPLANEILRQLTVRHSETLRVSAWRIPDVQTKTGASPDVSTKMDAAGRSGE